MVQLVGEAVATAEVVVATAEVAVTAATAQVVRIWRA